MMATSTETDLTFLTEAMTCMGGSLDIQKSLVRTFDFLEHHFPVEAVSLQQYSASLQSFKLLFLVRKGKFDFVEMTVPLPKHGAGEVLLHDRGIDPVRNYPDYKETSVGLLHSEALASYVHLKDRPYLLAISQSPERTLGLKVTMDMVYQLRGRELPVLILGETGTGKELIAEVIQKISPRKNAPFVKVNCGAIPESLLDSELFGHEKGAFTGATSSKPGRFEQANGGTLFLDEVGELTLQAQVRLLRVLQSSVVERVGGTRSVRVDVRVIAATNRDLELMMQEGSFREDLYYRLNVFPIRVPPLRKRTQDIAEMVYLFLKRACRELEIPSLPGLPSETVKRLLQYSWPGNVRELENLVRRGVTLYREGPLLLDEFLPKEAGWYLEPEENRHSIEKYIDARVEVVLKDHLAKLQRVTERSNSSEHIPEARGRQQELMTLNAATRQVILAALEAANGRVKGPGGAAEILDVNASTLRGKMRKLGIRFV